MLKAHCPHCPDTHYCPEGKTLQDIQADTISKFLNTTCHIGEGRSIQAAKLFKVYLTWAAETGTLPTSQHRFGKTIRSLGYPTSRTSVVYYHNLSLKAAWSS